MAKNKVKEHLYGEWINSVLNRDNIHEHFIAVYDEEVDMSLAGAMVVVKDLFAKYPVLENMKVMVGKDSIIKLKTKTIISCIVGEHTLTINIEPRSVTGECALMSFQNCTRDVVHQPLFQHYTSEPNSRNWRLALDKAVTCLTEGKHWRY